MVALWLANYAKDSELLRDLAREYGYLGAFTGGVISGFNLAVPIPAIAFLPLFLESGLNLWIVILVLASGMTLADSVAYILGKKGRHITDNTQQRIIHKLEEVRTNHPRWPLGFLFIFASLAPLPNEVIVIPMAFIGYKAKQVIPILILGNFTFNLLSAFGILNLPQLFT